MAADAYFGALDAAAEVELALDPRVYEKLAECLLKRGERPCGHLFPRQYRAQLDQLRPGSVRGCLPTILSLTRRLCPRN